MSTDTSATETRHTEDDQLVETSSEDFEHARPLDVDHDWYKRAVFYEVLVRAFSDSNRDGTGDLRGLTEKLDYLQWLGVDCLWLLPFYQSPLRDGGYDISDFFAVLPEYGNLGDVLELVEEAHKRGLRIIADLVVNHTEKSNWTYDNTRGQYYWHRFFSHQPDLNYDNPDVANAIIDVCRYWL